MRFFSSITRKVGAIILISLVLGIGLVVFYFSYGQNKTLYESSEGNLHQQADVLHQAVKNSMLPGEAPLVVSLFNDIQAISPMYDITLYRQSGVVAFSDDSTIDTVNKNIGMIQFRPKSVMLTGDPIRPDNINFRRALEGRTESFRHTQASESYVTIYKPLLNLPKCSVCHGADHTIRGVVAIRSNMTSVVTQARNNILIASLIFIGVVVLLFAVLSSFMKKTVLTPVSEIAYVASEVTKGNFRGKVPITTHDEIGDLSQKVNTMVDGLYERFELSKYVSSSTIASLTHSDNGTKTEMTLLFSDIRGFTSFSEKVSPETVVEHLNTILTIQTDIIQQHGGDIDKYVGDEIIALFTGEHKEHHACLSALEIQEYIEKRSEEFSGLSVGIGINTGEVVLGRIGSEKRADFTVIGDHVNYASRLCDKAQKGMVLISENTYQKVQDGAEVLGPHELIVKGKEQPQNVYVLQALHTP